jgi:hypothetical protein
VLALAALALLVVVVGEARAEEAPPSSPSSPSPSSGPSASSSAPAPWSIELSERLELAPGAVGPVRIVLRGRGRHSVAQSGLRLDLMPSARGISVRQRRYQRSEAVEAEAAEPSFSIPVRAEAAGAYTLEVRVRFWVCTAKSCQPVDERRTIAVEVREPPPPPPPPVVEPPPPPPVTAPPIDPARPIGKPKPASKPARKPASPPDSRPAPTP